MSNSSALTECSAGFQKTCPVDNLNLELAISSVATLDEIPHCFLKSLFNGQFLAPLDRPVTGHSHCHNIPASEHESFFQPPKISQERTLFLYTSPEWLYVGFQSRMVAHLHLSLEEAITLSRQRGLEAIIINPGFDLPLHFPKEVFDNLLQFAPTHSQTSNPLEIGAGEEIFFSSPDPEVPPALLSHLKKVFRTIPEVREVYLFALTQKKETDALVIGLVGTNISLNQCESLLQRTPPDLKDLEPRADDLELLLLEDPGMLEVIRSTVEPLFVAETGAA